MEAAGALWELDSARQKAFRFERSGDALRERLALAQTASEGDGLPDQDAWFGYLGYEAGAWLAEGPEPLPASGGDLPDLWLMKPRQIETRRQGEPFDNAELPLSPAEEQEAAWLNEVLADLLAPLAGPEPAELGLSDPDAYRPAVERVRDYLFAGDIYQANLTRRVLSESRVPAEALFAALRQASPSSHAALLRLGAGFEVVSASPELFLRLRPDGLLETRPIKGTLRKTGAPDEARHLQASEKDRAEHVMIVDLERNDLGRIAEMGSVRVASLFEVLDLPRLYHLESAVEAKLRPDVALLDAVRALFPGGSITGAPKIRAMEIIRELEPCRRNVYTGAIGWIGPRSLHLNIAIRTLYRTPGSGWMFHVGGGIVADSTPAAEWDETETKALGMRAALRGAAALASVAG